MEIALRRLDGVDKVSISVSRQTFMVTYKPGTRFQPRDLRDAVAKAEVEVVQFQIDARGRVEEAGAKRFFVAGKDKFLLIDSSEVPSNHPLQVVGIADDSGDPLTLKVLEHNPLKQ